MSVTEFLVKCFAMISCSYFPVINSVSNRISILLVLHPILCFLGRFIWSKSDEKEVIAQRSHWRSSLDCGTFCF